MWNNIINLSWSLIIWISTRRWFSNLSSLLIRINFWAHIGALPLLIIIVNILRFSPSILDYLLECSLVLGDLTGLLHLLGWEDGGVTMAKNSLGDVLQEYSVHREASLVVIIVILVLKVWVVGLHLLLVKGIPFVIRR